MINFQFILFVRIRHTHTYKIHLLNRKSINKYSQSLHERCVKTYNAKLVWKLKAIYGWATSVYRVTLAENRGKNHFIHLWFSWSSNEIIQVCWWKIYWRISISGQKVKAHFNDGTCSGCCAVILQKVTNGARAKTNQLHVMKK